MRLRSSEAFWLLKQPAACLRAAGAPQRASVRWGAPDSPAFWAGDACCRGEAAVAAGSRGFSGPTLQEPAASVVVAVSALLQAGEEEKVPLAVLQVPVVRLCSALAKKVCSLVSSSRTPCWQAAPR